MKLNDKSFLKSTNKINQITNQAIDIALRYQEITGRKLGITSEVGEQHAARLLGLRLCTNSIEKGFDAQDQAGKKVQIKSRRSDKEERPKPSGRTGSFSKHKYDYALLVILSDKYEVLEILKAKHRDVEKIASKHKGRNPAISAFKKISIQIYPN